MKKREYRITKKGVEMFPPAACQRIAILFSYSGHMEYEYPTPADLFLDLVGFRLTKESPPRVSDLRAMVNKLNYMSVSMIGQAMDEFAREPEKAMAYIELWFDVAAEES